jgi:hypothetical protein
MTQYQGFQATLLNWNYISHIYVLYIIVKYSIYYRFILYNILVLYAHKHTHERTKILFISSGIFSYVCIFILYFVGIIFNYLFLLGIICIY